MRRYFVIILHIVLYLIIVNTTNGQHYIHSIDPNPENIFQADKGKNIWAVDSFLYINNGIVQTSGGRLNHIIKINANTKIIESIFNLSGPHDDIAIPQHGAYTLTSDGRHVMVTGEWYDYDHGLMRLFLGKLDEDLKVVWINYFPDLSDKHVWAYGVAETLEGEYMVCFTQDVLRDPNTQFIIDLHVLKTDSEGNLLMNVMLPDTFLSIGSWGNINRTADGAILVNGSTVDFRHISGQPLRPYNTLVHKVSSEGEILWSRLMYPCPWYSYIGVNTTLTDGGSVVAWYKDTTWFDIVTVDKDFPALYRLDQDGNLLWRWDWYEVGIQRIYRMITAQNGDILGLGAFTKLGKGRTWLFRMTPDGELKWERQYSDSIQRPWSPLLEMLDITEMDDGRIAATGIVYDTNALGYINFNIGLLVLDSMGCITPDCEGVMHYITTSVVDLPGIRHTLPVLITAPNPARDACQIIMPESGGSPGSRYQLSVYDMQGVVVAQHTWPPGSDTFTLDTSHLPHGIYRLLLFDYRTAVATGKIAVVR